MRKPQLGFGGFFMILTLLLLLLSFSVHSQPCGDDVVMSDLRKSIRGQSSLGWSDSNCCKWSHLTCESNLVSSIQIGNQNLQGFLPPSLANLSALTIFEVQSNALAGPFPNLAGNLQRLLAHDNQFTSFPIDFFVQKSDLKEIDIDDNPFSAWKIPESIQDASSLVEFSANRANITGGIPAFFGGITFPSLTSLHLSMNNLEGEIPDTFAGSGIQSLWLNGQQGSVKLNGSISVLQNMTSLAEVWLHGNQFSGPLPDFSSFEGLQNLSLRDNQLTGIVPSSLVNLKSLLIVNLTNNLLQGPTPKFNSQVQLDMKPGSNSFCLDTPGAPCEGRVNALLSVAQAVGYPEIFAEAWELNDPCKGWIGITCDGSGNITIINFTGRNLNGTISPSFALLISVKSLFLSNNSLTGTIPSELTTMPSLIELDVSNNNLFGKVPSFSKNVIVITGGNPDIGKDRSSVPWPSSSTGEGKKSSTGLIIGSVVGSIGGLLLVGGAIFLIYSKRRNGRGRVQASNTVFIHPRHSGDHNGVKITVGGPRVAVGGSAFNSPSSLGAGPRNIQIVEAGSMVISIQVLRSVTNNFSEENILGRGGFGSVYKGELHDGTQIAVKRMESGGVTEKGLKEFMAEITVLTSVRHRNLVGLLGYCLDGHERLLVYEYMPQGTLSRHLFNWKEEGLKPLEWTRRLAIALDVARGVEYLHSLAHQSFIHRDLKPSNILLGDDMRAKVADFGLVRLAPEGKSSVETKLAGTFGYLAPEYAVTGRVTTKIDIYSFGVILMEIITGRKALDESQPEDCLHLVSWFQRMQSSKEGQSKIIDQTLGVNDDETLSSIGKVTELAGHCCAREAYRRPDMGHVVNVLSSLVELWKPVEPRGEQLVGIDFGVSLKQAVKRWQALEGNSNLDESTSSSSTPFLPSGDSIPTRPSGFGDSFDSSDGR